MDEGEVTYLGDGLYARFNGYQIKLWAGNVQEPTDTVYVNWHTYHVLLDFAKRCWPEEEGERKA